MNVRGITWLGSPTERFDEMMRFATDVLGLKASHRAPDFAVFELENDDVFEIFGPRAIADGHEFMKAPIAGFRVDDVVTAREEMERKGVLFIGPVHRGDRGGGWSHFFGPDGHVYEITSRA